MKTPTFSLAGIKTAAIMFFAMLCVLPAFSQDTLHINYSQVSTLMGDTSEAKIAKWAKDLNGKHVDVSVLAYFSKSEYKKYATERADEMFLVLNRKARSLITIQFIGPKKGENYQRSRVDIVYRVNGPSEVAPAKTESKPKPEMPVAMETTTKEPPAKPASPAQKPANTATTKPAAQEPKQPPVAKQPEAPARPAAPRPSGNGAFVAADEFKSRKLMVVLLDESEYEVRRMSDEKELNAYRTNLKNHNDNIKAAFKTWWKESSVDFITEGELEKTNLNENGMGWVLMLPGKAKLEDLPFMTYNISMVYAKGKKDLVYEKEFKISVRNEMPEQGDFLLLMHKMKVFFTLQKEFDKTQFAATLGAKTLYVDQAMMDISQAEFKEVYSFPFVYSNAQEIGSRAAAADKSTLYLKTDLYGSNINLMIVDAETGMVVARTAMSGLTKVPEATTGKYDFNVPNKLSNTGTEIIYKMCYECPFSGGDIFKLAGEKTKVKKNVIKNLADEKSQMKVNPLVSN